MDISITVSSPFMNKLMAELNQTDTEVMQDALSIYRWAVDEAKKGRLVVSTSPEGEEVHRLSTVALDSVLKERGVSIPS